MDPSLDGPHPDPIGHAVSATQAKAGEAVTAAVMLAQAAALAKARKDGLAAAQAEAEAAAARTRWAPALDPGWLADAALPDVARAWCAALPWEHDDTRAARALDAAEARMSELHPPAMSAYGRRRQAGSSRAEAMLDVTGEFVLDPGGDRAAGGLSAEEAGALRQALEDVARLSARAAEAGQGPLDPQAALGLRGGLPAGMAGRIEQGLADGAPAPSSPPTSTGKPTVASLGPGAIGWPASARAGVQAAALRSPGGRRHPAGRRAGSVKSNSRGARRAL